MDTLFFCGKFVAKIDIRIPETLENVGLKALSNATLHLILNQTVQLYSVFHW